jgi:hypothetical protein
MSSSSLLRDPSLYWAIAIVTLLSGASLVYISIKAPFFWGGVYLPGVVLLNVWALTTIAGAMVYLLRRSSRNETPI